MTRALQIGHLLLLLAGIAFLVILGWRAWTLADSLDAVFVGANGAVSRLDDTLDAVNRPCGIKYPSSTDRAQKQASDDHKSSTHQVEPCGTLATVNKTVVKIGDAVVTTQLQERAITPHTIAAMDNLNGAADVLTGTASAATQMLHSASDDLKTLNTSIAATKPLIEASTATVRHFDAAAPAVTATAANVQHMTADGARITKDAADEADKLAHPAKKKLGFWGGVWVGLTYIHKLMPPIF